VKQSEFIAQLDAARIEAAIANAERNTSGEIRVHVQPRAVGADLDTVARRTFERLGMTSTAQRNGVLLFIASEENRFVILGDSGIHEKVGTDFWNAIAARLHEDFKAGQFSEGIVRSVTSCGEQLKHFFPYQSDDVNELPNALSVSDEG
jgi:uncharacterized membrane protein